MIKYILFLILLCSLISCGEKSVIKNDVQAVNTAEKYGDGTYTIIPFVLPLSDQVISSYDSPLAKVGFIVGGFARLFMDLGASMGMGKMQISLIQPIPEFPTHLKEIRMKRVFFYIEPKKGKRDRAWYLRLISGKDDVDFKFLDKIAVKISTHKLVQTNGWLPSVETKSVGSKEFSPLQELFEEREQLFGEVVDAEKAKEMVLLKYDEDNKDLYLRNDKFGSIYIIKTDQPSKTRKFLSDLPILKGYFKRLHILNKSILVELAKDPVVEEGFKIVMSEHATDLERLGVSFIEPCTKKSCMDFALPDVNLLPLIQKNNGIKLDAFIDAGKVPESFKLKGFIEFEIKLKLGI
jgi:hypothetical protein